MALDDNELETTLYYLLDKGQVLDLIKNFIIFEKEKEQT